MKRVPSLVLLIAGTFVLDGCCLALRAVDKPLTERIAAQQSKAISAAHGGAVGTPITWRDARSGLEGTLLLQADGSAPAGCHEFRQTTMLAGQSLEGRVVACQLSDGSWKLAGKA